MTLFIFAKLGCSLPRREQLKTNYGIGIGESACLVLAERDAHTAVFLSSDADACIKAARDLNISFLTIPDILIQWVRQRQPNLDLLQELVDGMRNASFALKNSDYQQLLRILENE